MRGRARAYGVSYDSQLHYWLDGVRVNLFWIYKTVRSVCLGERILVPLSSDPGLLVSLILVDLLISQ